MLVCRCQPRNCYSMLIYFIYSIFGWKQCSGVCCQFVQRVFQFTYRWRLSGACLLGLHSALYSSYSFNETIQPNYQ